jgi:hypothetical protein
MLSASGIGTIRLARFNIMNTIVLSLSVRKIIIHQPKSSRFDLRSRSMIHDGGAARCRVSRKRITCLVPDSNAAAKATGTYLRDKFYRRKARRGYKRAAVAVAHKILVAIYHMFSHQVCYHESGDLYLDKLTQHQVTRNLVRRLQRLGYSVTLEKKAA